MATTSFFRFDPRYFFLGFVGVLSRLSSMNQVENQSRFFQHVFLVAKARAQLCFQFYWFGNGSTILWDAVESLYKNVNQGS